MATTHPGHEPGDEEEEQPPDPHPMAYMTANDQSPYLWESAEVMLGRASVGARQAARSRRGSRRVFAIVGLVLMVLVLVSIIVGVLTPLLTKL